MHMFEMFDAIWHDLYNLKNLKTPIQECYVTGNFTFMGDFHVFYIVQIVPNRATQYIFIHIKLERQSKQKRNTG